METEKNQTTYINHSLKMREDKVILFTNKTCNYSFNDHIK